MTIQFLSQIVFLILNPILCIILGQKTIKTIFSLIAKNQRLANIFPEHNEYLNYSNLLVSFCFGLLIYLWSSFILKCIGLPWFVAGLLPLLICKPNFSDIKQVFKSLQIKPSLNFILWFALILFIGISLFESTNEIKTVWINNYGDLTFHLGMITSFVFGNNFPPEYHIFAGQSLSYPFFINLWSAALWWTNPLISTLSIVFTVQWLILWSAVYFLLNGNRYRLLPWTILLGGATYAHLGEHSGALIQQGAPWSCFLSTIWVTQRSTIIGLPIMLCVLNLFHNYLKTNSNHKLLLASMILALSPLTHAHFFLVTTLYILSVLVINNFIASIKETQTNSKQTLAALSIFTLPMCLSFISLPWIIGKGGLTKLTYGWMLKLSNEAGIFEIISTSFKFWLSNCTSFVLFFFLIWVISKQSAQFFSLLLIFIVANFLQLAAWDWDQLKIFLALYFIFIAIWSQQESKKAYYLHYCAILLIIPALFESYTVLKEFKSSTVYSARDLSLANDIRDSVPSDAIIASAPTHNSPITLTGRKMFYGYEGTLWSHGIDFQKRKDFQKDYANFLKCKADHKQEICPDYLLWTQAEKAHWHDNAEQPKNFKKASENLWSADF